jgi:hypothetical protein
MLGQVTVTGYQVGDASSYNLNQDNLEDALNQAFPIDAPTSSDTTEMAILNAQLSAANPTISTTTLLTIGGFLLAIFVGIAISK